MPNEHTMRDFSATDKTGFPLTKYRNVSAYLVHLQNTFLTSPSASAVFEPIWTTFSLLTDVEVTEADPPPPEIDPPDLVSITLVAPPPPFVWTIVAPCDSTTLFFEVVVVVYSITSISVSSS